MTGPKDWLKGKVVDQAPTTPPKVQSASKNTNGSGFPWTGDIGTTSIEGIKALVRSSGINLSVVSSYRPGDPGLHGQMNAVDFVGSADSMRQVAAYLYQYSTYLLELIHTNSQVDGGGYYAKNGKKVPQSFYNGPDITTGGNIIAGHRDHIHVATTMSALIEASKNREELLKRLNQDRIWKAASGNSGQVGKDPKTPSNSSDLNNLGPQTKGCLVKTGTAVALFLGSVSSIVYYFM